MDNETFEIRISKWGEPKQYFKLNVEIFFRSEQVIRFKITAGAKSFTMEKLLTKNKGEWKMKDMDFEITGDVKRTSQYIMNIQDQIDFYLEGRPKPINKYSGKS